MATGVASLPSPIEETPREDSISPRGRSPANRSSSPVSAREHDAEVSRKTNGVGYVSSPLRVQQRLASLDDKQLPDLPETRGEEDGEAQGSPAPGGSFPFEAAPGALGPQPTNELVKSNVEYGTALGHGKKISESPSGLPGHRRSIQFARGTAAGDEDVPSHTPLHRAITQGMDPENERTANIKERQASFFGKLKALASPAGSSFHVHGQSGSTGFHTPNVALSPQSERSEPSYPVEPSETADADIEDSERDEVDELRPRKRKQLKRPAMRDEMQSGPSTPKQSRFASFIRDHPLPGSSSHRPTVSRRNTLSGAEDSHDRNAGVSEDEGRDRVRAAWRRGIQGARGLSYSARKHTEGEASNGNRPGTLRRFTGITSGLDASGSPFRLRADRQISTSAQKWRQVKAGLKMIGQRRRDERMQVDHQKSAQLLAELLAGAPAALVFASMYQRDEHGHRKVPVLLEQLKIRIPSSEMRKDNKGDRNLVFNIDLEYGNGPARMKWAIRRTLQDFVNLHWKYKAASATERVRGVSAGDSKSKAKMPKFPKSAFPYGRSMRGIFDKLLEEDEEDERGEPNDNLEGAGATLPGPANGASTGIESGTAAPPQRPAAVMRKHTRRKSSFAPPRRTSTGELVTGDVDSAVQREKYNEYQRKKLETYLQQMIRWLIFRPDSTRLCKFLELSALAIRLSAEGGYNGKQGLLSIASRRGRGLNVNGLKALPLVGKGGGLREGRHPRWFLVRHSYVVCVDGPESLVPYDVFLVDSDFRTDKHGRHSVGGAAKNAVDATTSGAPGKHHLIRLYNAEGKLKLVARSERQYLQFKDSLDTMVKNTIWSQKHRFGSFAPVRNNVWARWLVDGRDHMWQVSRAIDNAKDFIYIHDWWLSPELYLRRPASISQKWRLDRLLKRKAEEGVKIFVIVYRNVESAVPIDSEYTKWSLLDLHENICVQRSPNQFRQNQFFWAHHEKLVVVDNMMAFVGGVDLCFGRWDDPCHSLTDDKLTGFEVDLPEGVTRNAEQCQMWPGKDYSNPRVQDFYALDRPYEEMYDRTKVPRMPWHDIAMQIVGQPARDVGRHFVQRWNYILRSRVPSRPTPVLIPPPEYDEGELEALGMTGTCQIQILRSCSYWSIGTPNKIEHSIMNAYTHLIKTSEHFVYIENQFFISSTIVDGAVIHNQIGDALVERIIQARDNGENWQACLIIPLMPGFQNTVNQQEGTSVRLIMQCQFRSINRTPNSIFGRLRKQGIEPTDYIRFYSLRQWGKIGPKKCLTTEQLYIHAKCMVADDRTAIIGSANINERSMLGSRDSEVAAVVTDTKLLPSFMGGEPYEVGEFPHTLRKRLMREHLGIDVDALYKREQACREREHQDQEMERIYRDAEPSAGLDGGDDWGDYFTTPPQSPAAVGALTEGNLAVMEGQAAREPTAQHPAMETRPAAAPSSTTEGPTNAEDTENKLKKIASERLKHETRKEAARDLDVDGYGFDNMKAIADAGNTGLTDSYVNQEGQEVMLRKEAPGIQRVKSVEEQEARRRSESNDKQADLPIRPPWPIERLDTVELGLPPRSQLPELPQLDDTDIGGPALTQQLSQTSGGAKVACPLIHSLRRPEVHEDCMSDPLADGFYRDIWHQVAENNTKIYRAVFRCMPDDEVIYWEDYRKFNEFSEKFMEMQGLGASKPNPSKEAPETSGPPGSGGRSIGGAVVTNAVAGKTGDGRQRSKSVLSSALGKLRPGSNKMEDQTHTGALQEKERAAPGSPGSGNSSDPTAVPSPESQALDEKEAAKKADGLDREPSQDQGSFERKRTVQYSDDISQAPETTATQSLGDASKLQHATSQKRRRRATTKSSGRPQLLDEPMEKEEAEELLKLVQGRLVLWPYDWYVSTCSRSIGRSLLTVFPAG